MTIQQDTITAFSHWRKLLHRNSCTLFARCSRRVFQWVLALHIAVLFLTNNSNAQTQNTPIVKATTKANREKTYSNIIQNGILRNLAKPLSDSTELDWQDAFHAMELLQYKESWVPNKITIALQYFPLATADFQRAFLEFLYTNYPKEYIHPVNTIRFATNLSKIYAICMEYLLQAKKISSAAMSSLVFKQFPNYQLDSLLYPLVASKTTITDINRRKAIQTICSTAFLSGKQLVISFQRKNRDYPGLAIIRDSTGHFVQDSSGQIFTIPQLARSLSSLPFYLTNGNTPQGIFRMNGFDVSKNLSIGPTTNIQLMMPAETSSAFFTGDESQKDSSTSLQAYEQLLPASIRRYFPLYESYYAGKAGRYEIIAHGSTVNPAYYIGKSYYPFTPTAGCLAAKEVWNEQDGSRQQSDQQWLVEAIKKSGSGNGYLIVIEINDLNKAVSLEDVLPYLKNK